MSRQATNHVIAQLESLGYLERRAGEDDDHRRVWLTARSRAAIEVIHASMRRLQAEWAQEVGPDRFADFMATLRHIVAVTR